jgi:uncharacterized NAD-dependent epimerase/dehydratase family protein
MYATKLKGQVTADRRLIVEQVPKDLAEGAVEVIVLQAATPKPIKRPAQRKVRHPAFGLWAKRPEVRDSALFAEQLRHRVETRENGQH